MKGRKNAREETEGGKKKTGLIQSTFANTFQHGMESLTAVLASQQFARVVAYLKPHKDFVLF